MTSDDDRSAAKSAPPAERPLLRLLNLQLPWCGLADFPSPVHALPPELWAAARQPARVAFTKRDDLCSKVYGGNKVRALEPLLAEAKRRGAEVVYAAGASGSNHVLATALHAEQVGLRTRAILFSQPPSQSLAENLSLIQSRAERVRVVPHWSLLPAAIAVERHRARQEAAFFLPPGGASPLGVLGSVSAALELGEQIDQGLLPPPKTVVVGLGSGGTAAGLLLGFWLATQLRVGFATPPRIMAVRVAPWPLASRGRVVQLALQAALLLARITRRTRFIPPPEVLWGGLEVEGGEIGAGYGHPTRSGVRATKLWQQVGLNPLDLIYSAKVAAALLRVPTEEPSLFWSTKSSAVLPAIDP